MPYVPVQRDAGRIMYESAMQRAQSMGQTARNITDFLYQKDEENKAFGAKLKSLETLLQTHSDKFGMDEDQLKQFLSVDPNESPKERYLRVGGFIEGTMKASDLEKEKVAREESQARAKQALAQAARLDQERQLTEEDIKFWKDLDARARAEEAAAGRTVPPGINPNIPASIQQFGGPAAAEAPSGQMAQAAPAAGPAIAQQRPSAVVTTNDLMKAKADLGPRATAAQIGMTARANAAARAKEFVPAGVYQTEDEAINEANRLDKSAPIPGYVRATKYDPQAKGHIITQLPKNLTPEEKAREAGLVKGSEVQAANAAAYLENLSTSSAEASDDMNRLQRIRELYKEGLSTGFASGDWFVKAQSLGAELGMIDPKKQASKEELIALLSQDSLAKTRTWLKGQGSVANAERERIDRVSTDARKRPEANLELVKTTEAVYKKLIAAENERMALEDQKLEPVEIHRQMRRWWLNNKLDRFMEDGSALPTGWTEVK